MWLCPACEASGNCKVCDGTGFLTDLEFTIYERKNGFSSKLEEPCNASQPLLTLDLSEFESESNTP